MDNQQPTTAEIPVSKTKNEIIKESKRIEESLLYSSRGHFAASHFWSNFHLLIGIPMVIALAGVMTFLNPNEKCSVHLNAGNNYDSLMNKIRIFWSIDCWRDESEQVLTERLKYFSEQKDKLNQSCPQIPRWAYVIARKGITNGEGDYKADKEKSN